MKKAIVCSSLSLALLFVMGYMWMRALRMESKYDRCASIHQTMLHQSLLDSINASKSDNHELSVWALNQHLKYIEILRGENICPEYVLDIQELATYGRLIRSLNTTGDENAKVVTLEKFFELLSTCSTNILVAPLQSQLSNESEIINWVNHLDTVATSGKRGGVLLDGEE